MAADGFQFPFTPAVQAQTAPMWEKVKRHVTPMEWQLQAPLIAVGEVLCQCLRLSLEPHE